MKIKLKRSSEQGKEKIQTCSFLQPNSSSVFTKIFAMKLLFRLAEHFVEEFSFFAIQVRRLQMLDIYC